MSIRSLWPPDQRTIFRVLATTLPLIGASLGSCREVQFSEKERLVDPIMVFESDRTETHFFQNSFYSREGSAGGIGATAGGGCGCY